MALPAGLLLISCGGSGLKTVNFSALPGQTATPDELVASINEDAALVSTLKCKLGMGLQKGPGEEARRCSGMLVARNGPAQGLYLKGYKRLIPTFFTLVSDGQDFWFHIPRDDVVYTGPVQFAWSRDDSLELYLNAGDMFRALFLRPIAVDGTFDVGDEDSAYAVSIYTGDSLVRKLWVEKKRFTVVREMYYDSSGQEQLEIQRGEYVDLGGRLYPASVVLRDMVSGSSVFLDFNSITLDPENVPENAFHFEVPDGVEVKRVDNTHVQS